MTRRRLHPIEEATVMKKAPLNRSSPRTMTSAATSRLWRTRRDAFSIASWTNSIIPSSAVLRAAFAARVKDQKTLLLPMPQINPPLPIKDHKVTPRSTLAKNELRVKTRFRKMRMMAVGSGKRSRNQLLQQLHQLDLWRAPSINMIRRHIVPRTKLPASLERVAAPDGRRWPG